MEIGDLLRREREKKGLSLSDVENDTKIRVRYIQALETEQFEIIPGEVYRLGFLKNYARLLDLDPETIIASYKSAREGADRGASPGEEQAGTRQFVGARRSIRDADQPTAQQKKAVAHRPDARRPVIDWAGKIAQAG
jgi:cytoskeletal protein RodZ